LKTSLNEKLHKVYSPPNNTGLIKLKTPECVAYMGGQTVDKKLYSGNINPLNPELNPICYLLALLRAHHFLHVRRIRVKLLTLRLLMSYKYGAPIFYVSRSHATTQHSR